MRTTLNRINQASNTIDPLHRDIPFAGRPLMEFPSATIDEVEAIIIEIMRLGSSANGTAEAVST